MSKPLQNNKSLIHELKKLDSAGVNYFEAKQQLRNAGYSESEIVEATYMFSYDGKPDPQFDDDIVRTYYAENPQEAERMAKYLLRNQRRTHYGRKASMLLASRFAPGLHARSYYMMSYAGGGWALFWVSVATVPLVYIVQKFNLPREIATGPATVYILYGVFIVLRGLLTRR